MSELGRPLVPAVDTGSAYHQPLRYAGGKWNLARWIIGFFPDHGCYVEPFGGGASCLLWKPRSPLEVYNDLDGRVVNFFRVLRERSEELIQAIELTPYSRAEYQLSYEPADDPVEAARRFYVRAWQGIGGATTQWRSGWRFQKKADNVWTSAANRFGMVPHLWDIADRLRGVQIENDEALTVIRRFDHPNTLFYLDPPYVHGTRSRWANKMYVHEMDDEAHRELAALARSLEGLVIISGYPSGLYEELYEAFGWQRVERRARTNNRNGETRIEGLWLSPRTAQALETGAGKEQVLVQLPMWANVGGGDSAPRLTGLDRLPDG